MSPAIKHRIGGAWVDGGGPTHAKIGGVFVELGAAPAFAPDSVAGLQLWLDAQDLAFADGASITAWVDKSPAARTVTVGSAPTLETNEINGRQTAMFVFTHGLSVPHHADLNMHQSSTVFVVTKTLQQHQGAFVGKGNRSVASAYLLYNVNTTPGKAQIDRPWVVGGTAATAGVAAGTPYLLTARIDGTAVSHFLNGVANGTSTIANGSAGTWDLQIGRFDAGGWDGLRAHIGELLIFNVAVSDPDRSLIEDYLLAKWGFA